jgi:hypothetical protein
MIRLTFTTASGREERLLVHRFPLHTFSRNFRAFYTEYLAEPAVLDILRVELLWCESADTAGDLDLKWEITKIFYK